MNTPERYTATFRVNDYRFRLQLRQGDRHLYVDRYLAGDWHESKLFDAFAARVNSANHIFDIGAHIGWYTCLAGTIAPTAYITAFEMNDANARLARANVKLNRIRRASVVRAAMCERPGALLRFTNAKTTLEYSLDCGLAGHSYTVRALSVDSWCDTTGARPDVVKIDVEGVEERVLRGMTRTIRRHRPTLFVEVHSKEAEHACRRILTAETYELNIVALGPSRRAWSNRVIVADG